MHHLHILLFIYLSALPNFLYSQTIDCPSISNEMDSLYKEGKNKDIHRDYKESLKDYEVAWNLLLKIEDICKGDQETLAHAKKRRNHINFRKGQAYVELGQLTIARPYLEKAYEEFDGENYNSLIGRIIYLMILETRMGYFKFAKEYRYKGEQLIKEYGDFIAQRNLSQFYKNAGQLYYELNICDTALIKTNEALALSKEEISRIEIKNLLANIFDKLEEHDKSISLHLENIEILETSDDDEYLSNAYLNISPPYKKAGQYQKAIQSAEVSMSFCSKDKTGNTCRADASNNLSDAYCISGQLDSALYYAHQSLIYSLKEEGFHSSNTSLNPIEEHIYKEENLIPLLEYLKSKALAQEKIYQKKPNLLKRKQDLENTLQAWKTAQEVFMNKRIYSDDKPFWNDQSKEMYDMMMRLAYQWKDYESAYHTMEKSKMVLLRERLRHLRFINEYGVDKQDLKRLKENPSFQDSFDIIYPGISKMLSTTTPNFRELKSKIAHDQALIYYYISKDDNMYALVLDKHNRDPLFLEFHLNRESLNEWKKNLEDYSGDSKKRESFNKLGNYISNTIFKPIKNYCTANRFIIVPDGEMYGVSFDAFYDNENQEYLVEKYAFSYIYSGEMLIQDISKDKGGSFMGFAPVHFLKYPELELSQAETEEIAEGYNGGEVYLDSNATKNSFLKLFQNGYKVIHLSSHGEISEEEICIYFHKDTSLLLSEIAKLKIPEVKAVSLSACKAGHQSKTGEGVMSLSKAFIMAGADWVVAPQGYINEETAHEIFTKLHEYQSKGYSPDIALQKSKKDVIRKKKGDAHYDLQHWAQIVIVGNTSYEDISYWKSWVLIGTILAVIIGIILYRRKTKKNR